LLQAVVRRSYRNGASTRTPGSESGGAEKHPNPKLTARSASLAVRSYGYVEKEH